MDAELSAHPGASVDQPLQWFYGQEDKKESWEHKSSLRQEQLYQSHNHTRKGFAKGSFCMPGSPQITSFFKGIQGSLYITLALPKVRFYHI